METKKKGMPVQMDEWILSEIILQPEYSNWIVVCVWCAAHRNVACGETKKKKKWFYPF